MKHLFKTLSASAASAVIAVCSVPTCITYGADTETEQKYTVHYDISEDGVFIPADKEGNVPELNDVQVSPNSSFLITDIKPEKEGFIFSGWTSDDIIGYTADDVYRVLESDVTLHPVWVDENDDNMHTITFYVENYEDAEKYVPSQKELKGRLVTIPTWIFPPEGYKQRGWTDGVHEFAAYTKVIVHDEDITFTPNLKKLYTITYTVGDADRINGVTSLEFEIHEDAVTNLQALDRFSRSGFTNIGWHCEDDGKDYDGYAQFIMPSHDVTITPIWEPIYYTILFKPTSNSSDNIKVQGYTDTYITAPECTVSKEGYKFGGWKYNDVIVQPGEKYLIKGSKSGLGISFTAVWNKIPDYPPYCHVVNVYCYSSNELINDAQLYGLWTLVSDGGVAEPIESIDTSKANPAVFSYEKYLNEKECSFKVLPTNSDSKYFFHKSHYTVDTDEENHITYHNVYLSEKMYGDANCDLNIDMSDVVLIMQSLANPNKYGYEGSDKNAITELGLANADVWNTGDGVTGEDALHIQKYLLGLSSITAKVEMVE
ncbi:MAG: dockerin type I repeat-containing protein [Ruminococcus sp.]|uniref:dockerin type I repeat-containing protein n=1 Tax=Ruminococcus sp. TaxID=41978 RepID=UPI0025D658B3|nr:dockerin type I repeat-containing protein [Ruminococcus sp.]MCR4794297.1 dockerin type I repeat-containing protein [Ruminococcus sp.]